VQRISLVNGRYFGLSVLTVIVLVAAWFIVTNAGIVGPTELPSPQALVHEFHELLIHGYTGKSLWAHTSASLARTLTGLGAAIVVGVPLGLLMGASPVAAAVLTPIFSFLRPIPAIALIPLIILYFGIGEFSKIFVIFITATLYIILNASAGVKSVPQDLLRAGVNMGLNRWQLFAYVILPGAAPYLMTGIKTATAVSWALVVASELIAAQVGLGYMIMDAATFYRIPDVYIAIAIIGLLGLALESCLIFLETRLIHWRGK
jgi:NitT/TauT family transport system permease protein